MTEGLPGRAPDAREESVQLVHSHLSQGSRLSSFVRKKAFSMLYLGVEQNVCKFLLVAIFCLLVHLHTQVLPESLSLQRHWGCWHEHWGTP